MKVTIKHKYVKRVVRHNKRKVDRVLYYSVPPMLERMRIPYKDPLSPQFKNFVDARNQESELKIKNIQDKSVPPPPGTFVHLAEVYRGNEARNVRPSREWARLKEKTAYDYGNNIDNTILKRWGHFQVCDLTTEAVAALHESFIDTPYKANQILAVVKVMIKVACKNSVTFGLKWDPCSAVSAFGRKEGIKSRRQYWTYEEEALFSEVAQRGFWELREGRIPQWRVEPAMAFAHALLTYTGQRPGDMLNMTLADYDGEKINVYQQKTGARVWIPVHTQFKPTLDALVKRLREQNIAHGPLLRTHDGQPFKARYFASRWDAVSNACGLRARGLQRRDLRRTAVIRLYEAGCTKRQVAAITGHTEKSVDTIIETYTVTTYPMAQAAITKLEEYQALLGAKE